MPQISLASVRVNAELSQEALSEILNVDRQTVINWEKGYTEISGEKLLMWAQICKFPIDYIRLPKKSTKCRA